MAEPGLTEARHAGRTAAMGPDIQFVQFRAIDAQTEKPHKSAGSIRARPCGLGLKLSRHPAHVSALALPASAIRRD